MVNEFSRFESGQKGTKNRPLGTRTVDFRAKNPLWSKRRDSNSRPHGPEPCALPTALRLDMERKTGIEPATFSLGSYCSTVEPFPHSSIDSKYYRKLGIFSILTNYITIVFVCQIVLCGFAKVFFRAYTYYARQRPRVTTCLLFRARRSLWFFRRTNQALCPRCGYAC